MNTETEIFRGYGKICEIAAQTAVECRFGQEVETIIATHASVSLTGADAENGEVRYRGKAHFLIVYADAEKRVCRAEKGVEFSARAEDERCFPALTPRVGVTVENLSVRREGASVYLTALIGADIRLYGDKNFEYLAGGDVITKREPVSVLTAHLCGGAAEAVDEFETEFIGDILLHTETVGAVDVLCGAGSLKAEGEVNLGILALKGDGSPSSFERLVPFEVEIPCEEAAIGRGAEVRVSVLGANIKADTDVRDDEQHGRGREQADNRARFGQSRAVVEGGFFRHPASGYAATGGGKPRFGGGRKANRGRRARNADRKGGGRRVPRSGNEPALLRARGRGRLLGERHGVLHGGAPAAGRGNRRGGDAENLLLRTADGYGKIRLQGGRGERGQGIGMRDQRVHSARGRRALGACKVAEKIARRGCPKQPRAGISH